MSDDSTIFERPAELLQNLIRFDTTNPPGRERACVQYVADLLDQAGIPYTIKSRDPDRPNLVARLEGQGSAAPLLLQGHVDVVNTEGQSWQQPPFGGDIIDGFLWGRGTLDMKGGVAMMLAAMLRAKAEGTSLPGDVLLAVLSDEEAGGRFGAHFLVEQHPGLFEGVRYSLGEFGGISTYIGGKCFYPIQVNEKQLCGLRATLRGPGGHGSSPIRGGAMAKLGKVLTTLDQQRLPVHITPVPRQMVEAVAAELPEESARPLLGLLDPSTTGAVLDGLGPMGRPFAPMFYNTVSPTIVHGGTQVNVIPSEIVLEMDGRMLPGFTPDDMVAEMHTLIGEDVELEVVRHDPGPADTDMSLFDMLGGILKEGDPGAIPVPMLLSGVTDGRHFAQLGIQTYGFTPMRLPEGFNYGETIHAADERIPVEAVNFGSDAMFKAIQRFGDR